MDVARHPKEEMRKENHRKTSPQTKDPDGIWFTHCQNSMSLVGFLALVMNCTDVFQSLVEARHKQTS